MGALRARLAVPVVIIPRRPAPALAAGRISVAALFGLGLRLRFGLGFLRFFGVLLFVAHLARLYLNLRMKTQ